MNIAELEAKTKKSPYTFKDDGDFKFFDPEATDIKKEAFFTALNKKDINLIKENDMGAKTLKGAARPTFDEEEKKGETDHFATLNNNRASKYSNKDHDEF